MTFELDRPELLRGANLIDGAHGVPPCPGAACR